MSAWTALMSCVLPLAYPAAPVNPLPAIDGKWRHFASPHFELYSRNADGESRELLYNLELLRAVFLDRIGLKERLQTAVTVYYFRTPKEFQAYAPRVFSDPSSLAGFHLYRPDRAIISLAPADNEEAAQRIIFHEYVHHLFRIAEFNPSLWYNEGTAEVLAGIRIDRKSVQIGQPLDNSAAYLREETLLPLDQIFGAVENSKLYTEGKHTGVFYAQSWALLHYWNFGNSGIPKEAVDRFLQIAGNRDLAGETDLRTHFQACFGCDYPEMLRRLKTYIRTGSFRYGNHPMPTLEPVSSYIVRQVPLDEIAVRLAELAVRVNRSPAGKLALLHATTDRPTDPRSFETLGSDAFLDNDLATASDRWEQALAAGSQNPAVIRQLALLEGQQWFNEFNESLRLPPDVTTRMRARLERSIELEPAQGAAYEMLAWVEAFAEVPRAKNANRVISNLPQMPDKKRTLIALSMLMLRLNKPDTAATMLAHVSTQQLRPFDAHAVAVMRERLAADHIPSANDPAGAPAPGTTVAPPPSAPGLKTPSVGLPDDL